MIRRLVKYTAVGRWLVVPYRFLAIGMPHVCRQFQKVLAWTFRSKEHYNHTYELAPLNRCYLDSYIAVISGHDLSAIQKYSHELDADEDFRETLRSRARASRDRHNSDVEPRYGRRVGWYSLVRATKPAIIIETGVDKGLGTAVIAAALKRNAEEGFPGKLYATDIVRECGNLLDPAYRSFYEILIGDSVESLKRLRGEVDIFIHDSDHRPEYEWAEFLAVEPRLHATSLVLSDNSQETSKLLEFAERIERSFLFFQDVPEKHWWAGDGIGAAFVPGRRIFFPQSKQEKHESRMLADSKR